MSEKQQTAVEWLEFEINRRGPKGNNPPQWLKELYNKAKEMEHQQITDSYKIGARYALISQSDLALIKGKFPTPEQYYNETFKSE